jgi:hypothetical protein
LFVTISLDPVFYFTEYHFHKNSLWTKPAAENPPEYNTEKHYEYYRCHSSDSQNKEVLKIKGLSENKEVSVQNIEQKERIIIDFQKRKYEKYA